MMRLQVRKSASRLASFGRVILRSLCLHLAASDVAGVLVDVSQNPTGWHRRRAAGWRGVPQQQTRGARELQRRLTGSIRFWQGTQPKVLFDT